MSVYCWFPLGISWGTIQVMEVMKWFQWSSWSMKQFVHKKAVPLTVASFPADYTRPLQLFSPASLICDRMLLAWRKDIQSVMLCTTTNPSAQFTGSSRIHLLLPLWHSKGGCGDQTQHIVNQLIWQQNLWKVLNIGYFMGYFIGTYCRKVMRNHLPK